MHRYRFDGEYSRAAERVPGEDNGLPRFLFSWCRSPRHQRESRQESYSWHPYPSRISSLFNESASCDIHPQQSQWRRFDLRRALLPDVRRRKGTWRELPINAAFWDIAYVLRDGEERVMKASLYPDVHPNKPGRYRYFYEITIKRKPVLMMAEFRLTDNEEEWRTAEKTSLPPYISDAGKGGSPQLITEEPMEEPVYKVVEVMPEFPGGMKALMDFIQKNIRYPEEVRKNGIQGRVAVSVVIDENGRVTDPVIMRSRYPALDEEALRIVELMPQWKPGMQQGKAVKVEFTFPVTFKLE